MVCLFFSLVNREQRWSLEKTIKRSFYHKVSVLFTCVQFSIPPQTSSLYHLPIGNNLKAKSLGGIHQICTHLKTEAYIFSKNPQKYSGLHPKKWLFSSGFLYFKTYLCLFMCICVYLCVMCMTYPFRCLQTSEESVRSHGAK